MRQIAIREIGMLKDLYSHVAPYIGLINMALLAATAYYTTIRHFLPITFAEFLFLLALVVACIMLLEYTVVLPSHYLFINEQAYKHGNLIRRDLQEIRENELREIRERLKKLEEVLGGRNV